MREILRKCPFCGSLKLYSLATKQLKCAKCKRKSSPARILREQKILDSFCKGLSARECSKKLGLNYITVSKAYNTFRRRAASFMEADFAKKTKTEAYGEYIYLPKYKKGEKRYIFDAFNFLTFNYGGKIYNIPLCDLSRYKPAFLQDGLEELYFKEFEHFLRRSHIQSSEDELIRSFWNYFESFITRYRGVGRENFFLYLKEAEFRFNFGCKKLKPLLSRFKPTSSAH